MHRLQSFYLGLNLVFTAAFTQVGPGLFDLAAEQIEFGSNFTGSSATLSPGKLAFGSSETLQKRQWTCDPGYVESTRRATVTVFNAEEEQAGQAMPEFTCPATTFTEVGNSASLELGDNCKLTLQVNEAEESSTPVFRREVSATTTTAAPTLERRQDIVCTATLRGTTTIASTSWTTTNITVAEAPTALPEFSCLAMVVTNSAGDELALGDDCSLEYTPAEASADGAGDGDTGDSTTPEPNSQAASTATSPNAGSKGRKINLSLAVMYHVPAFFWISL
ncbi:hypothetical protein PRZ48_012803 [Zasmidium cellare]|uniref:SRS domain-containing protein n=1 Tax=Zasmidium cellare TaxID=395010 RepID=A0ABR0E5W0_ZASCE|nr:hypothetical protein PRZ48_012803 [Zasmidium cellare]